MISIFCILVYVWFAYVMCNFAKKSLQLDPIIETGASEYKADRCLWYYILFFAIVCALRGRTGVDTLSYINVFKHGFFDGDTSKINGEWLFYYLCEFISKQHIHFVFGLGVCGFVQIFFITKGILPYRQILCYFPVVLFGGTLFLDMSNAVRQMMAAAIFFYSIKFIVDKKMIIYGVFIFVASLLHHSALMLLPLYFIPNGFNISSRRNLLLIIYLTCFFIGLTPQFQNFMSLVENMSNSVGYENYIDDVSRILNTSYTDEARAFGPMQLSYFICGLSIIWYGPQLGERYSKTITTFNLWYLFAVAYGCFYFLVCNVSHLMIRPIMYFLIFQSVILALLIQDLFTQSETDTAKRQTAWGLIAIIWVNITWNIIKHMNSPVESVTYKLFFL